MADIEQVDHATAAYERLCQQFKDKPNVKALLAVFTKQFDELEAALLALLVERTIFVAVGAQLDQIGVKVGQPRQGLDDETYRRYILARIAANKSDGLVEDLIDVTRLILNDDSLTVQVVTSGIATEITRVLGRSVEWPVAKIVIEMLRASVVGGVRALLEFGTFPKTTITKVGGAASADDAGVASITTISGDGSVQFRVDTTSQTRWIGLSSAASSLSINPLTFDYAIRFDVADYGVYENGANKLAISGVVVGDILSIRRAGAVVTFARNGVTYYTSTTPSTGPLRVDIGIATLNALVDDIALYDEGHRVPVSWQNVTNVIVSPDKNDGVWAKRFRFSDSIAHEAASTVSPATAAAMNAAVQFGDWSGPSGTAAGWLMDGSSGNLTAAYGGQTLTPNATPLYNNPGFRRGRSKAIGFNSSSDGFSAAAVGTFDIGADEIICAAVIKFNVIPLSASPVILCKNTFGGTEGFYQLAISTSGAARWDLRDDLAAGNTRIILDTPQAMAVKQWHLVMSVLDRINNRMRVAWQNLETGAQSVATNTDSSTLGSITNTATVFKIGASSYPAEVQVDSAWLATGPSGAGIAGTLAANLPAAMNNLAATLNKPLYDPATGHTATFGDGYEDVEDKYPRTVSAAIPLVPYATLTAWWNFNEASGSLAAAFGSPTLTAVSSPTYGGPGLRRGNDRSIGFDSTADAFDGADNFDIPSTDDLVFVWGARVGATPASSKAIVSKYPVGGASAWTLQIDNVTSQYFLQGTTAGSVVDFTALGASIHVGKPHVGIAVIGRSTGKARVATSTLDGTQSISAEVTVSAIAFSNAAALRFGDRADTPGNAPTEVKLAFAGLGVGTSIASNLSANIGTALTDLVAGVNRIFGDKFFAAME